LLLRRLLIAFVLAVPALILIGWLVASQLPRWTAPQANWFPPNTPGVCAAVDSLVLYQATRADVGGIGNFVDAGGAAQLVITEDAAQFVKLHYGFGASVHPSSVPLGVQATLPGDQPHAYYLVTMRLSDNALAKVTVMYLDAQTGDIKALITAIADPAATCNLDVKAALLAAAKSLPFILLAGYAALVIVGLIAGWLFKRRGTH
jgi:hypothetical protein